MKSTHTFILLTLLIVSDVLIINLSYALFYFDDHLARNFYYDWLPSVINHSWLTSALITGIYKLKNVQSVERMFRKSAYAFIVQCVIVLALNAYLLPQFFTNTIFYYILSLEFLGFVTIRIFIYVLSKYYLNMNSFKKNIAIIGRDDNTGYLIDYFHQNKLTYRLTGFYADVDDESQTKYLEFEHSLTKNQVDEIYVAHSNESNYKLDRLLYLAEQKCIRVNFLKPTLNSMALMHNPINANMVVNNNYNGVQVFVERQEPLTNVWNRFFKRAFDISFSLTVIIFLLSWLIPLVSLLILLESRGSVIFSQLRSGRNNKPFYCFKFRSMQVNKDSNQLQATRNDPRITKVGAFIRKTSIDELPQFFNVLIGNMSIVGPRPHMLKHTEEYRALIDKYMVRHFLKPGITGWAQVSGYRGETKEHRQMLGRVKHDIWYMENWSFLLDLKVIIKTVKNAAVGEANAF